MNFKKELRKPSNLINIGVLLFIVIYSRVAEGAPLMLFDLAVWVSLAYAVNTVVTPWIMEGLGLKDPVEPEVDQ